MPSPVATQTLKLAPKPQPAKKSAPAPEQKESDFDAELEKAKPNRADKPDALKKPEVKKKAKSTARKAATAPEESGAQAQEAQPAKSAPPALQDSNVELQSTDSEDAKPVEQPVAQDVKQVNTVEQTLTLVVPESLKQAADAKSRATGTTELTAKQTATVERDLPRAVQIRPAKSEEKSTTTENLAELNTAPVAEEQPDALDARVEDLPDAAAPAARRAVEPAKLGESRPAEAAQSELSIEKSPALATVERAQANLQDLADFESDAQSDPSVDSSSSEPVKREADSRPELAPTFQAKLEGAQVTSTRPQAPPAPPPPAPEAQFASDNHPKIITGMRSQLIPGGGTMHIRLDPPELGALQVTVHMEDGVMTATFQTSSDDATRLLSHSLSQLKHVLETQGVSVEKLHVQQAPRDQQQGFDDSRRDRQSENSSAQQEQQRREMLRRMWRRLTNGSDPLDMVA